MLEELDSKPFVNSIFFSKFECNAHEVKAKHAHVPARIRLFKNRAIRHFHAAIDNGNVVHAQESAFKNIVALAVNLVDPPSKVDDKFVETSFEKITVCFPSLGSLHVINTPNRPSMNRRIKIREFPFIGRYLAIRVLELLKQQEVKLFLGEFRINPSNRRAGESKIPCSKPRVFPFFAGD